MKLGIVFIFLFFLTIEHSLAQIGTTPNVTEALVCSSQDFVDCKKIKITNLVIQNLFSFEPIKVTFDIDGKNVTLPMQVGKGSAKCAIRDFKHVFEQSVLRQVGYYVSKQKIDWGRPSEPGRYAVHETIEFIVYQYSRDNNTKFSVDYTHSVWCPTVGETLETVVYRIGGVIN